MTYPGIFSYKMNHGVHFKHELIDIIGHQGSPGGAREE